MSIPRPKTPARRLAGATAIPTPGSAGPGRAATPVRIGTPLPARSTPVRLTTPSIPPGPRATPGPRAGATPAPRASRTCPDCNGTEIEDSNGQTVCLSCGTVISESNIVSEVTFGESSQGAAVVHGGTVGDGQQYARSMGKAFRRMGGGGGESREQSLRNGRDAITALATTLHVPSAIDPAVGMFSLAHSNGFVQGRPIQIVGAVCLYIACRRQDGNTILLIDLAEKVQINVYALGNVYKALIDAIYVNNFHAAGISAVIEVEPLLLKYAQRLEFGDKTNLVAADAAQILSRMNRDWMVTGRTPNGLCGACLVLAARMNNFRRSIREIVYVVKTSDATILHRLTEFKRTTAGQLSVDDFRKFSSRLKKSHDPPSLYLAEEKARRLEKVREKRRKLAMRENSEVPSLEGSSLAELTELVDKAGDHLPTITEMLPTPAATQVAATQLDAEKYPEGALQTPPATQFTGSQAVPQKHVGEIDGPVLPHTGADTTQGEVHPATVDMLMCVDPNLQCDPALLQPLAQTALAPMAPMQVVNSGIDGPRERSMRSTKRSLESLLGEDENVGENGENRGQGLAHPDDEYLDELDETDYESNSDDEEGDEEEVVNAITFEGVNEELNKTAQPEGAAPLLKDPDAVLPSREGEEKPAKRRGRKKKIDPGPITITEEDLHAEEILEKEITALLDYSVPDNVFSEVAKRAQAEADSRRGPSTVPDGPEIGEAEFDDDPEVANCLLSEQEIVAKEKIWVTLNADWLREQQLRQIAKEKAELLAGADGKRRRRRKRPQMNSARPGEAGSGPVSSAAEATARMLERRLGHNASKKVNYDLLRTAYGTG